MLAQMKEKVFPPRSILSRSISVRGAEHLIHEQACLTNHGYTGTTGRIEAKGGATRPGLTDPVYLLT